VAQDAARADDEIIDSLGDGVDLRSADENTKRNMVFQRPPAAASRLRQMNLVAPVMMLYLAPPMRVHL